MSTMEMFQDAMVHFTMLIFFSELLKDNYSLLNELPFEHVDAIIKKLREIKDAQ